MILAWSVGPMLCWLYFNRERMASKGRCLACGYDLHGLSQMRCPECGRAFTLEEVKATAEELRIMGDGAQG